MSHRSKIKALRNEIQSRLYSLSGRQKVTAFFKEEKNSDYDKTLLIVIAFERPDVLNLLLSGLSKFLPSYRPIVFDNSRGIEYRLAIEDVASSWGVSYLGLPKNITRHPNRSHALALNWITKNILYAKQFDWVGFIDHDLIPVRQPQLEARMGAALSRQIPYFGHINHGKGIYWNLWSGYAFFHSSIFKERRLNFLYDFSRGLDTGGGNWTPLFSKCSDRTLAAVETRFIEFASSTDSTQKFRVIDDAWIHLGSAGHKSSAIREELVTHLNACLFSGSNFFDNKKISEVIDSA